MGQYTEKSNEIKNDVIKHHNNLVKFTQKDHLKHFQKIDRHIIEHDQRAAQCFENVNKRFKDLEKKINWTLLLLGAIALTNIAKELI